MSTLPILPAIAECYLDWRTGLDWQKDDDGSRFRTYVGPIEVGMVFAWEPDIPTARQLVIVCAVTGPGKDVEIEFQSGRAVISGGHEGRIWTLDLDSPLRGKPDRWKAAMGHIARPFIVGAPVWNDEGRFREAVVATTFNPQTP